MAMTSNKGILSHLKDNSPAGYELTANDAYDRSFLRRLSSKTVGELASEGLLVFPQAFGMGDSGARVLDFREGIDGSPDCIYTCNMLGFIGYGGTEVCIRSRFDGHEDDFLVHYMLMRIGGLNVFNLPSGYKMDAANAFNLLFYLFPRMLNDALATGVIKKYVSRQYNDSNVRGRIDIARHLRENRPKNGRAAYCVREHSTDNPVTELIRHCIELMSQSWIGRAILNADGETRRSVQTIRQLTPAYSRADGRFVLEQNLRSAVHPLYFKYAILQHLCVEILRHRRVNYADSERKIHGLLVDGAWLWEEYVAKTLAGRMRHLTLRHCQRHHLFADSFGDFQRIVPDYLSLDDEPIVGDAKYMALDRSRELPAGKAEAVYYKTLTYMLRFNSRRGFLFYPAVEGSEAYDYSVKGTHNHLYKLGIKVSEQADFRSFCLDMKDNEAQFLSEYDALVKAEV